MNQSVLQFQDPKNFSPASSHDGFPLLPERSEKRLYSGVSARLEQALSALSEELLGSASTRYRLLVTGRSKALDGCVQEQVYRVVQEALHNALRHAGAASVEVEIEYSSSKLRVVVRDNGCGIRLESLLPRSRGGLLEMQERAAQIGAQLRIWSREGAGTEIEISVPGHIAHAPRFTA